MAVNVAACRCLCHNNVKADYESACHFGRWADAMILAQRSDLNVLPWADIDTVTDASVIEAAVAQGCTCLDNHSRIFLGFDLSGGWAPGSDDE